VLRVFFIWSVCPRRF